METQEADPRLMIGRGPREDRGEERVEELNGLAARDEHDEFVVLRKLNDNDSLLMMCCQPIRSLQLNTTSAAHLMEMFCQKLDLQQVRWSSSTRLNCELKVGTFVVSQRLDGGVERPVMFST